MNRAASTLIAPLLLAGGLLGPERTARAELLTFPDEPVDVQLLAFRKAIRGLHTNAARSRKPWTEESLRKLVPRRYLDLEKRYVRIADRRRRALALAQLALLYSELAWVERIGPISRTLEELDKDVLARLGHFEESDHFLVRVVGTDEKWGKAALKLAEAARRGYVDLFGFASISKVPGKKIRILIHVDPGTRRPRLYFHPTPPFHSEMRYEVPDEKYLTLAGRQRIVYGFCHEMGHMVAMWGEHGVVEEDRHAWAHYTGCLIVETVYDRLGNEPWPTWTAFQRRASGAARLRKQIHGHEPGTRSYEAILSLFHAIGNEFGTETYGKAWVWLEKKKRFRRINSVPYLRLRDLREALLGVLPREGIRRVRELFGQD